MKLLSLITLLLLAGCSSHGPRNPYGPGGPGLGGNPYVEQGHLSVTNQPNKFTWTLTSGWYKAGIYSYNVNFNTRRIKLASISDGATDYHGRFLLQMYAADDALIYSETYDMSGQFTKEVILPLIARPDHIVIDLSDYTGAEIFSLEGIPE